MKIFTNIIFILLLCSCAQQAALTGGNKDTTPPRIVEDKTIPKPLSTHFKSKTIILEFDEYIKLKSIKKNFFVNPQIKEIEVEERGKTIVVSINETLKDNTTYTFNFGDAIEDITENNILKNFKYVVSTGPFIDSNFFEGTAVDAFTKKSLENSKVFLFDNEIDTLHKDIVPKYITNVTESGYFKFDNLTEKEFYLIAIEDVNSNNKFERNTEKIGFIKSPIIPVPAKDSNALVSKTLLFPQIKALKIIEKKYTFPGKLLLIFNQNVDSISVLSSASKLIPVQRKHFSDSLEFWTAALNDRLLKLEAAAPLLDSIKTISITTSSPKKIDSTFSFKEKNLSNIKPGMPLILNFNHPINSIDTSKMLLLIDSTKKKIDCSVKTEKFSLFFPNNKQTKYTFIAEPGAFNSIYGFTNDSIKILITLKKANDFGSILLNLTTSDSTRFITQLLKNNSLIHTFSSSQFNLKEKTQFLNPGSYNLRVIKDSDGNGKWSSGNFNIKRQPESIAYYNKPIEIKAGWDIEVIWDFK